MNLTEQQIREALTGAVRLCSTEEGLRPWRFSAEQEKVFLSNEIRHNRAGASAGMTLDFWTDSRSFSMECLMKPAAGIQLCALDVMQDGELVWHEEKKDAPEVRMQVLLPLKKGVKRVTVYLPNLYDVCLERVALEDGASFEAAHAQRRILFLGDSITQGYFSEHPSRSYAHLLARQLDAHCLNQAIGGAVFEAAALDTHSGFRPDFIIAAYGTNDWNLGKDIAQTAAEWFAKLGELYRGVPVYVLLPVWRGDLDDKPDHIPFMPFRSTLAKVCEAFPAVHVIDTIDFVPHKASHFYDHVHPNEIGFACYAANIIKALKELGIN